MELALAGSYRGTLWKRMGEDEQWIRFYTNDFCFWNPTDAQVTYRLHKRLSPEARVCGLERDGVPLDFALHNSVLTAELKLEPGEGARIHLSRVKEDAVCEVRNSPLYQAKVASRRLLSEFRDNYIARNQWLLAKAESLKTLLQSHNSQIV